MTILNIAGTSGSGKSTVVHALLHRWPTTVAEMQAPRSSGRPSVKPLVYHIQPPSTQPIFVCGSYRTVCGGVDTITDYKTVLPGLFPRYAPQGHILYEGLLISGTYGVIGAALEPLRAAGHEVVIAFLDTPLEVCLERIQARRAARGNTEPLNPKNTTAKWNQTRSNKLNWERRGYRTVWLDHRHAYRQVARLFGLPEIKAR